MAFSFNQKLVFSAILAGSGPVHYYFSTFELHTFLFQTHVQEHTIGFKCVNTLPTSAPK